MIPAHSSGAASTEAVRTGFRQAAPVVVAAALIMFSVFAGFVPAGEPTIVQEILAGTVDMVVNTPGGSDARRDGYAIRTATTSMDRPIITTVQQLAAERARLSGEQAALGKELEQTGRKLDNEKFLANAKPEVVASIRERNARAVAELARIEAALAGLPAAR